MGATFKQLDTRKGFHYFCGIIRLNPIGRFFFDVKDINIVHRIKTRFNKPCFYDPFEKKKKFIAKEFSKKRPLGISAYIRAHNEEETIERVIVRVLPYVDEIIVGDNNSSDNTYELVRNLKKKNPRKIRIYKYPFKIIPQGGDNFHQISEDSLNSFVNFSNYLLSKASFSHVMKIDGDDLIIDSEMKKLKQFWNVHKFKYISYSGLNLFKRRKQFFFLENNLEVGGQDHGLHKLTKYSYYIRKRFNEELKHGQLIRHFGILYFHLKFLKKNFGLNVYNFKENPNSPYRSYYKYIFDDSKKLSLIPYLKFQKLDKFKHIPNPNVYIKNELS